MRKYRITTNGTKFRIEKRFWRPFPVWKPLDSSGSEADSTGYCESGYTPPENVKEYETYDVAVANLNLFDPIIKDTKWREVTEYMQ